MQIALQSSSFIWVYIHDEELPCQKVEDIAEDGRGKGASEDDDVVWHAEVRCRQVNQESGCVYSAILRQDQRTVVRKLHGSEDRRGQVPSSLGVRRMLRIP